MDRLRLNPVSQRHVTAGSCAGVWLIGCEPVDGTVRYCRECGGMGRVRSSWRRRFVHMPVGQHAVHLLVRVRRYECMACARSWTDDLTHMADEGRRLTDAAVWWAVAEVVLKSKSVLACARDLHCSWGVLNRAVLEKGADVLAADLRRLDGVEAIGVDGHVWRHTRTGGRYVTVIVDLTPRRHGPGLTARRGRGRKREGVRPMARRAPAVVLREGGGGRDGCVRGLQEGRRTSGVCFSKLASAL